MVEESFPLQQEAAFLRFHRFDIVAFLDANVRAFTRPRVAAILLGISLCGSGFAANTALAPAGSLLAMRAWEGGDDVSPPGHNPIELGEPPAGPPLWERGPTWNLPDSSSQAEVAPKAEQKAEPQPAPEPPVVNAAGKVQLPSAEKIASELGYKQNEFKRYVEDFAASISQGPRSPAFRHLCARDEESCRLLADFQAQAADAKRERRRGRKRPKHFRITEANVSQAQRFEFPVLANNLKVDNMDRLSRLAEHSLKEAECPRNLSAALAIKAEEFYPDPQARALSKQLFDHGRVCLQPEEEVFERLHLRFGLYALYEGDKARAKDLLLTALKSKNSTERYRVLYWLGRMSFESEEAKGKENEYWSELMNGYPLSFYAIDASVRLGHDPLEMITQRKVGGLKREAPNDPELNRMIRWLEALYAYKESNAVAKWASWIVRANEGELDVDVLLYLSSLKIASGLYRSNIQMLFSYFRKNPAALNQEGLKLLYPRPYYDLVQETSKGRIDTFLVLGLMRQESGFDARAISRVKAKGLMQIIPKTARRLASQGHRKLLDEKENTKMGVKYLLELGQEFENSVELVLAAYNAGPHRVIEWQRRNPDRKADPLLWNDLIPYMETRDYVVSILRNNYLYLRLYGAADDNAGLGKAFSSELVRELLTKK